MSCAQVAKLIAERTTLPAEAVTHLRNCPGCSGLAAMAGRFDVQVLDAAAEDRIIRTITADLTPVNRLAPTWRYACALIAVSIAVAVAGILILGLAGWHADSGLQRSYFSLCLSGLLILTATMTGKVMIPGALLFLRPAFAISLGTAAIGAGALLYPLTYYEHFVQPVGACLSIGLAHAAVACALTWLVVRRGVLLLRPETMSIIGFLGGLSGMVVLYVFCPHRDLGHFSLAHATVPLTAALLGRWIAAWSVR